MGKFYKIASRNFSPSDVSAEIIVSVHDESCGEKLLTELKECVKKWNRRREYYGGSGAEYCIELKKVNAGSGDGQSIL